MELAEFFAIIIILLHLQIIKLSPKRSDKILNWVLVVLWTIALGLSLIRA